MNDDEWAAWADELKRTGDDWERRRLRHNRYVRVPCSIAAGLALGVAMVRAGIGSEVFWWLLAGVLLYGVAQWTAPSPDLSRRRRTP